MQASLDRSDAGDQPTGGRDQPIPAQHAQNPVDWWEWGEDAFAEARQRNVPILLSIGYAACHWCHEVDRSAAVSGF